MAEAILNSQDQGLFRAYSAGPHPVGEVHPYAIHLLNQLDMSTVGLRSKSCAASDAPPLNFVFTVCDDAAGESHPPWRGEPLIAHWSMPDPAAEQGKEAVRRFAFADTYRRLSERISVLLILNKKQSRCYSQDAFFG
jgi:arsenate reductase (thioredoxin)